MKIWFDILHLAQLNFYSNSIIELSKNNTIIITLIKRGKLLEVTKNEFGNIKNCTIIPVGHHSGSKVSAIIDANILRLISLFRFYYKHRPQIAIGNGFLHGIIGKTFNIPCLMFGDDIERKLDVLLKTKFSTKIYYVIGSLDEHKYDKISIYNALKEWAYLSPNYFNPNIEILSSLGVEENKYIFVREVITGTLNYHSQDSNMIATIANRFPKDFKVILSLEDKSKINYYPKDWILLQEPINDIHSIIYYSKLLISSGDSMAREGAMLGVPSIYCGVREMNANKIMIEEGMLFHKKIEEVPIFINQIIYKINITDKVMFRNRLYTKWIDVTEFIVNKINNYLKM